MIDPLRQETEYVYDNRDNLFSLKDAKGNITYFEYNRNNRLVKEIRPMGEEITYQYDGVGNLVEKIDSKDQKTEYSYDDAGRLVEIRYFNPGDHVNPVKTVFFTYDKVGNLKTYTDGLTSAEYFYDDSYRKTSETVNYGSFASTYSYTYYKNSTKKSFTAPNGITYDYTYDSNNQLTSVQIPGIGSITYPSYTWNRPASVTLPGGSTRGYAYDPLMRIESMTSKDPGQNVLLNYQYTYDSMDNITAKQTEHGNYNYGYDDLYRLNSADNPVSMDQGSWSFRFNCFFLRRCVGSFVMYRPAVTVLAVSFDGPGAFAGFACCHGKCLFLHNVTLIIGHPESQGWWGQNRQVKPFCFYFMAYALS